MLFFHLPFTMIFTMIVKCMTVWSWSLLSRWEGYLLKCFFSARRPFQDNSLYIFWHFISSLQVGKVLEAITCLSLILRLSLSQRKSFADYLNHTKSPGKSSYNMHHHDSFRSLCDEVFMMFDNSFHLKFSTKISSLKVCLLPSLLLILLHFSNVICNSKVILWSVNRHWVVCLWLFLLGIAFERKKLSCLLNKNNRVRKSCFCWRMTTFMVKKAMEREKKGNCCFALVYCLREENGNALHVFAPSFLLLFSFLFQIKYQGRIREEQREEHRRTQKKVNTEIAVYKTFIAQDDTHHDPSVKTMSVVT